MKLLPILLLISLSVKLPAQQLQQNFKIKGTVIDSANNAPLAFATVVLKDSASHQPVVSGLTKGDGSFELSAPEKTPYELTLTYMGYQSKTVKVNLTQNPSLVLGKIMMSPAAGQLKEISIIATKPFLKQEIDRISYDVQADPESKANDALEMLQKVPMVTVDGNDNIRLKGSDSYQIFINGKPSPLMTSDPATILKAMPAATIERIEVITTPPAKYDSEGLTGIINIITVKKKDEGFNGSIFGRYNNTWGERSSITISAKEGKLGVIAFFGGGHQGLVNEEGSSQITTTAPATQQLQQGYNLNGGNFYNGNMGLSYEVDTLNLITASMDFNHRDFTQDAFRFSQLIYNADSLAQSYQLNNIGNNTWGIFDFTLNYQLGFKHHKDELLTFSYQFASYNSQLDNAIGIADPFNYDNGSYDQQDKSGSKENTIQLDFVSPLTKTIQIEAGTKAILRDNFSGFYSENVAAGGALIADTALTNQFNYQQDVYSIYNSCQLKLNAWAFKAGVRAEHTVINGDLTNGNVPINQDYTNVTPSLSAQLTVPGTGSFTTGFSERIQRPTLSQLNPFTDRSNPDMILTGNPDLRPILNHLFELSYSSFAKTSLHVSLNYAFANNTIQNVTSLISDTVSQTTYLNIGKTKTAGVNLSLNYPITDRFNFNINGQLSEVRITGTYNSQFYKNSGYQGNIFASAGYKFGNGLYAGVNGGYFSGAIFLQGESSNYLFNSLNANKDFFKKKLNVSLTIYSPFQPYNEYVSTTRTPDFEESVSDRNIDRNFRIGLNYKFGHLNNTIKTNKRGIEDDDVTGAKGSNN